MITAALLLLLSAEPLNDAPELPVLVKLGLHERRAFRPGCVVNSVLGRLPNDVRVEVGKELVLVGSDMPIETMVELVCRYAKPKLAEDGVVICPEGSKPSAFVKLSGETVVECLGGAKQTFKLVVREEAPSDELPSTIELYEGEARAFKVPCKPSRLTLSNSAAWIEMAGSSTARVVADKAGTSAQAIYCEDPEVPAVQIAMKVWPFEKDLGRNVKAQTEGFRLFVGEERALFAPCELESFEKTGPVAMKKRGPKAWLVSAKAPGDSKLQFTCVDGSKVSVDVVATAPTADSVPVVVSNRTPVMYESEKRIFKEPCTVTRMNFAAARATDVRMAGAGMVSLKAMKPGKSNAVMACSNSLKATWLVEVLPW